MHYFQRVLFVMAAVAPIVATSSALASEPGKSRLAVGATVIAPCSVTFARDRREEPMDEFAVSCADRRHVKVQPVAPKTPAGPDTSEAEKLLPENETSPEQRVVEISF